jgi:radical SAM protein with 4Fe4S-binding SPASM domain
LHTGAVHEVVDSAGLAPLQWRRPAPDVAVNLHGRGPQSHAVLAALQPRQCIAFAHADVPWTSGAPAWRSDEHEVARWCRLLAEAGIAADPARLQLQPPPGETPANARGATLIHPGAASAARRWPAERWVHVARAEADAGRTVIITGGAGEIALVSGIAHAAGIDEDHVYAGRTDVLALARLVAVAGRVVCGDTGVAHLATALGTPSVVIFGPTSPHWWGPPTDLPRHRVLWAGMTGDPHGDRVHDGLLAISSHDVVEAVRTLDAPPPLPRELQVEVTGACNLKCRMCLVRYRPALDRTEGSLTFERFARIVDALPALQKVTLQGLGEPLLAPDLFRMIAYAAARGVRVGFNTNATLLTRRMAERLVDAGLDWLHVSLDGSSAATYESIRDGARFDVVRRHVAGLVDVMRERAAVRPRLSLVFVAMQRNVHELPDLVRLAAEWGVPTVRVQNLSHSFSDTDPAGSYREIRDFTAAEALWEERAVQTVFDDAQRQAQAVGVALRLPALEETPVARAPGQPGCDWPWQSAYVRHDGRVQPCCMVMGADRAILGDAATDGIAAVWQGEPYQAFRRALTAGAPPEVCRGCSMYRGIF